ncbi:MAG: 2-amino-4-hydroxy-6-hydroxymethyldihydropteridine diphosphokinase [Peptococcaceae bacterium]|nr:2-amino-4-hydroxy-6-hydroxymethyldihydropteridine diphosphokinase [Peptococcaceae bacterium]
MFFNTSTENPPVSQEIQSGNKIRLRGMEFFAFHGVMPEERALGQRFVVDVDLTLVHAGAYCRDDLDLSVDYTRVYSKIAEVMTRTFCTIEYVAEQIAQELLTDFACSGVRVEVHKPAAPIQGVLEDVSVEIVRSNIWRVFLSLGSNLGDRAAYLSDALGLLGYLGTLEKISHVYETEPVGGVEQAWFYNLAVELETPLAPLVLLDKCRQIEALCGRRHQGPFRRPGESAWLGSDAQAEPSVQPATRLRGAMPEKVLPITRWGPRTMDIDILIVFRGPKQRREFMQTQELTVPHPRLEQREFVLAPLREIVPELVLPSGNQARQVVGEGRVTLLEEPFFALEDL